MSATATMQSGAVNAEDRVDPKRLIAFIGMVFGMFLAILDIQIVSASLTEIQAGLSASNDEISWVQTAYLIAEVIAIPLSGFLSRALGTRILFAGSAAGFTFASFMCGLSTSIDGMIFWRAVQGFIGGGMIPTVFASAYLIFPRSKMSVITPVIGLVATLAPTIGPTVGGYLTEAMSWHWLFFVNIVPGIVVSTAAFILIDFDRPDLKLFNSLDWIGLGLLAAFLGSLEYVLEEGPRQDWLDDTTIAVFAVVSILAAAGFFFRALTAQSPIVDLRAYGDRNFAMGSMFSFVMGIGLYGLTYMYPIYLAQIRGYDALMIGETMFVSGLAMFMTAPIAGRLSAKVDPRLMLFVGFLIFSAGAYMMTDVTKDWDFDELLWPQILRGVGLMLAMVPITNVALGTLSQERLKNASGLYNLMRNLGGAIGLAAINTALNDRTDLHIQRLHDSVSAARQPAVERLAAMTQRFAEYGSDAQAMALKVLSQTVHREATVMAFADVFLILCILTMALAALSVLMKRPAKQGGGGGGH